MSAASDPFGLGGATPRAEAFPGEQPEMVPLRPLHESPNRWRCARCGRIFDDPQDALEHRADNTCTAAKTSHLPVTTRWILYRKWPRCRRCKGNELDTDRYMCKAQSMNDARTVLLLPKSLKAWAVGHAMANGVSLAQLIRTLLLNEQARGQKAPDAENVEVMADHERQEGPPSQ